MNHQCLHIELLLQEVVGTPQVILLLDGGGSDCKCVDTQVVQCHNCKNAKKSKNRFLKFSKNLKIVKNDL